MRRGALLKEAQFICRLPMSVGGGDTAEGNWPAIAGLCGPGSVTPAGILALIAPCGGSSGLPNVAARTAPAVSAVPAAVAANISRLEIIARCSFRPHG